MSTHPIALTQAQLAHARRGRRIVIPIDRALMDSNLLGATLCGATWSTWLAVLQRLPATVSCRRGAFESSGAWLAGGLGKPASRPP